MLQFQEAMSICKIEFRYKLKIVLIIWENQDLFVGQEYTLTSVLAGRDHNLDVGSTFRIKFSIC